MARGWESKSVESQMESATAARMAPIKTAPPPDQIERENKRDGLLLTRIRVLHDLQSACNARYRQQLQEALAFLDLQISGLG
jgi:hypothetical protein